MIVKVILLDYLRHEFTDRVMKTNKERAQYFFEYIVVDKLGISAAVNEGLRQAGEFDYVVIMGNDIEMPEGWLKEMVRYAETIPTTGTVGIHTVEHKYGYKIVNGLPLYEVACAFGNNLIPKKVIEAVGGYNEDYDPYGTQDYDFSYRVSKAGFINYYIPELKATHLGHDVGQDTDYRRMKDDSLKLAHGKMQYWFDWYEKNGIYLPYVKA